MQRTEFTLQTEVMARGVFALAALSSGGIAGFATVARPLR
jgi:hypothetical protein